MQTLGFKGSIIASVMAVLSGGLTVANYMGYVELRDATEEQIVSQFSIQSRAEARLIQDWFVRRADALNSLADFYKAGDSGETYVELAQLTKATGKLDDVMIATDMGQAYATYQGTLWHNGIGESSQYDPTTESWYQAGEGSRNLTVTESYLTESGQLKVAMLRAIEDGVVRGDIDLTMLQTAVDQLRFDGAVAIVVDDYGHVLASSDSERLVGEIIKAGDMAPIWQRMQQGQTAAFEYQMGTERLGMVAPIILNEDTRWSLFISVDKQHAFAELQQALIDKVISSVLMTLGGLLVVLLVLRRLFRPIILLKTLVQGLASGNGDLTKRLPVRGNDDDIDQIGGAINALLSNLQAMLKEVAQASDHISGSIEQVHRLATNTSHGLSAHQSATEEAVVAIEQLNNSAAQVANSAAEASQFTHDTNQATKSSRQLVFEASSTVTQLVTEVERTAGQIASMSKDTEAISSILHVIEGIAGQTNLLALNAAIEAARAGEQGRGFAVVADEVRNLAGRTQNSTAEVSETLGNLNNSSQQTIAVMETAKRTCELTAEQTEAVALRLDGVGTQVDRIDQLSSDIANAAAMQNEIAQQLVHSINEVHQIAQQLSENGANTAAEAQTLASANNQLLQAVGQFKIE
ncbi:methyl-accepting chemotaxis protein [Ferrimonas senticii]|uniref:methyl-accepting chemotaxis protein n=1 Tax=Ferrimonas senticii TaxID=394566 RepID=UPI000414BF6B|nr:methyl-accepting chemotaxis protein [Ferrimonas senticii]